MATNQPFSVQQQIGFGDWYLEVTSSISNYPQTNQYNQVQLNYSNTAGSFQETVFLNPQVTSIPAHVVKLGQQQFTISAITFAGATTEQAGSVFLSGTITKLNGEQPIPFNGQVCGWLTTGPVSSSALRDRFPM